LAAVSMSMSIFFLDVVAWGGDLSASMKGTASSTKVQVPAQLPGRVSSKSPLQYYQTLALPTKSMDWFLKLLKDWISLHPVRFPTFVNHPLSSETWDIVDV
jgi:hypothetical protein